MFLGLYKFEGNLYFFFGGMIVLRVCRDSDVMFPLLTPDFDMCQGGVLRRRKGFALYDRQIWRGDRVPRSKDFADRREGG